jgi:hypothetical protein
MAAVDPAEFIVQANLSPKPRRRVAENDGGKSRMEAAATAGSLASSHKISCFTISYGIDRNDCIRLGGAHVTAVPASGRQPDTPVNGI